VNHVVTDVKCKGTGNDTVGDVGGEDDVGQLGEGRLQSHEQDWGHDQSHTVHLESMHAQSQSKSRQCRLRLLLTGR
jgi:hypothetical protein